MRSVAKVTRPKVPVLQPRTRLYRRLDKLRQAHSVAWIVAPAGSGKTALVAGYIELKRIPALWYRVDEGDRHAENLFFYLRLAAEALERSRRAGVDLPSFSPAADVVHFSRRFFEALFARLPTPAILVFDDYHLASEDSPWQVAMQKAIACIPDGLHVVVLSRRAPPTSLARFAVHGDIGLVEIAELLLTEKETIALGKRWSAKSKRPPSRADLVAIHAATGGWAAGVSLLLRRDGLQGRPKLDANSDVQPIFDYLASAVFSDLRTDAQRLLLRTAFLPRFTVCQAEAVSEVKGARAVLLELYRTGFFLECDNTNSEVFRYHALFRSFLVYRAEQVLSPDDLRGTRACAARLLREEGLDEQAFELLSSIGDSNGLSALVLECAPTLVAQGRIALLERWLSALPGRFVRENGWIGYWRSVCALMTSPSESLAGFEAALAKFEKDQDGAGAYLAWAGAIQALTYEGRAWHGVEAWLDRLTQLERIFPAFPSAEVGSQVATSLVMGLTLIAADPATVDRWAARALSLAQNASDPTVRVLTASVLVLNYALHGDSGHAAALAATLGRESRGDGADLFARVAAKAATTALAWHQGDAEASLAAARDGIALMGERRAPMWQAVLLVFGSYAAIDLEDFTEVGRFLKRLAQIAELGTPLDVSGYHAVRAHEAMARGDLSTATVAIELSLDRDRAVGFPYGVGRDLQLIAYAAFELGDTERALKALDDAKHVEREHRDPILPYWRALIEADHALRQADRPRSIEFLKEAFAIGRERQVYSRHALTVERLADLCGVAWTAGIEPEYTRTLVQCHRLKPTLPSYERSNWPWPILIYTLSRVAVVVGSTPVSLGRARMLPLLLKAIAQLSMGGRMVSTSKLQSILWPDAEGDAATQVFEVTLLRLRRQLGSNGHRAIRLGGGCVSLDRSICWTDSDALDALLQDIAVLENPATWSDTTRLGALSESVLASLPKPFAGSYDLPPRLAALDDRLRSKVASAVLTLCRRLEHLGQGEAAESMFVRALELNPSMEALLAPAARLMVRRGRSQQARDLLDMCRQEGVQSDEADALLVTRTGSSTRAYAKS